MVQSQSESSHVISSELGHRIREEYQALHTDEKIVSEKIYDLLSAALIESLGRLERIAVPETELLTCLQSYGASKNDVVRVISRMFKEEKVKGFVTQKGVYVLVLQRRYDLLWVMMGWKAERLIKEQ